MMTLTKSKYLIGLQCPKCLWISEHEPQKVLKPDKSLQHRFDQGHLVGDLAKKSFPEGINILEQDFNKNLITSKKSLALRKILFEAGFLHNNLYSRADVLLPVEKDEWDIIEIKSGTEVKEENIHDVSFQKYVYTQEGIKIRKCFLMHINKEYIRDGNIDIKQLFIIEDITKKIEEVSKGLKERIDIILKILNSKECPKIKVGSRCKGDNCSLSEDCWSLIPENSVFNLYRGGKLSDELYEKGILTIKDIPDFYKLNDKQKIQHNCEKTKKPHIDKEGIKSFLSKLKYPLHFLDFETYGTAIPLYNKLKPYQQVPFQFSLHILDSKESEPRHYSFLASGKEDPRPSFLYALKEYIGENGSIIVYNKSFEETRLKELSEFLPDYKKFIESILSRIVDLLIPFREFKYYNQKQQGSASIKIVLPVLTGKSYENLEIKDGDDASLSFLDITFEKVPESEVKKIREDLIKYCGLDTEGMILIVKELEKISEGGTDLKTFLNK